MRPEIILAESAGFCFGVSRSIQMAEDLLKTGDACCSLGELIHNSDVIADLQQKGLIVCHSPDEVIPGSEVIIRAHGAAPSVIEALADKRVSVKDATCPKVKAIHNIVRRAAEEKRFVVIIGNKHHPEVEGICGWADSCMVAENCAELEAWLNQNPQYETLPVQMVIQTTQTGANFEECAKFLKKRCTNLKISDTICSATFERQSEAEMLSSGCDAMVVIGGKQSANSIHLAEICREHCSNVQFIERASELNCECLRFAKRIGITAGASTPAWIIKEVRNKMSDEVKVEETVVEKELSFEEMLEDTLKPIYNGDKVTCTVVAITGTEISVELASSKYSGIIPAEDFAEAPKVGDVVEAVVVKVKDLDGTVELSKKRLDDEKIWVDLEAAVEDGTIMEGTVVEDNKGGVVVKVKGIRVFVPASQTDLPREAEMAQLLKQNVKLKITEVNKARKRVVGSIRAVARAERKAKTEALWNEIEVGSEFTGTVKSLTSYGAFVDIGGIDGMVHVSEMGWGRVHQPSEVVAVGDEVKVHVVKLDKEARKISLSMKNPEENPWAVFTGKYATGDVASVKVVKLMEFGAFAEVVPGVDGLIHISQIANRRIGKPGDVLTVGDVVDAKITAIDEEKKKVSLSIRALSEPAAEEEAPVEE